MTADLVIKNLHVNVEGQERRLTGTAQAQYESWRRLLKEIYRAETGFTGQIDTTGIVLDQGQEQLAAQRAKLNGVGKGHRPQPHPQG